MIKEKKLLECREALIYNSSDITVSTIQEALTDAFLKVDLPHRFETDLVKFGGLFFSTKADCLILSHPDHQRDYYKFCICPLQKNGKTTVRVFFAGESKQLNKTYRRELSKNGVKNYFSADPEDTAAIAKAIGSAIGGAIGSIGKSKKKLQAEEEYYRQINAVLDAVIY